MRSMMSKLLSSSVIVTSCLLLSAVAFAEPASQPASKPTTTPSVATTFPTPAELEKCANPQVRQFIRGEAGERLSELRNGNKA